MLIADHAWLPQGWGRQVGLALAETGTIDVVETGADAGEADAQRLAGWLLPGIPNLHSHAFQRAMAGLAERQTHPDDSFWTWRETMYRVASGFDPERLRAVAAWLYVEMLEAGYTHVCEFHYLHHAPGGGPYADPAAMSLALIEAAREAGIGLTLLPVLYQRGGFDGRPLGERQRRFGHDLDGYLALLERLAGEENERLRIGMAFHSLRAVPESAMTAVLRTRAGAQSPIHLHIAEQIGEVQDCLAQHRARPVEWLLARMPVDAHWTLVHATHLDAAETRALAASGATVALCPSTEANLGDGLFPLREFMAVGGRWGIGSDSQISISPVEELRWLEYGQRLHHRRRNLALRAGGTSVGESLLASALDAEAATGCALGRLAPGARADFIVLDPEAPALAGQGEDRVLDAWIFSGNRPAVREVWVGGRRVVAGGRHHDRERLYARYREALGALLSP